MKSIQSVDVSDKKVLVRADLDVPMQRDEVVDDFRLKVSVPTFQLLQKRGAEVTVIGHRDRPGGVEDWSLLLKPVVKRLQELAGVEFSYKENLRFDSREERNDDSLAKELAEGFDLFVNESFASCHREHASIVGVPKYLPSFAGIQLVKEVEMLTSVVEAPPRPLVFVIGGGKKDKVEYVEVFSEMADVILVGGVLSFEQTLEGVPKVRFPVDAVDIYDIGPRTVSMYKDILKSAKTVVWNGPMGKFEEPKYEDGTKKVGENIVQVLSKGTKVVVGGGDTVAALHKFGMFDRMGFVSTGGGAMLEFLANKSLPGIDTLDSA